MSSLPMIQNFHPFCTQSFSKRKVDEEENSLDFGVESQRRFLSKLANDLRVLDVCFFSLLSPLWALIFRLIWII